MEIGVESLAQKEDGTEENSEWGSWMMCVNRTQGMHM